MRFALDNDALRRAVAAAIRRDRCVRRGYKRILRSVSYLDKVKALFTKATKETSAQVPSKIANGSD